MVFWVFSGLSTISFWSSILICWSGRSVSFSSVCFNRLGDSAVRSVRYKVSLNLSLFAKFYLITRRFLKDVTRVLANDRFWTELNLDRLWLVLPERLRLTRFLSVCWPVVSFEPPNLELAPSLRSGISMIVDCWSIILVYDYFSRLLFGWKARKSFKLNCTVFLLSYDWPIFCSYGLLFIEASGLPRIVNFLFRSTFAYEDERFLACSNLALWSLLIRLGTNLRF